MSKEEIIESIIQNQIDCTKDKKIKLSLKRSLEKFLKMDSSHKEIIYDYIIGNISSYVLDDKVREELCDMSGHHFTRWKKIKIVKKDYIKDYYATALICSNERIQEYELKDKRYKLVDVESDKWERHCTKCGKTEYLDYEPVKGRGM